MTAEQTIDDRLAAADPVPEGDIGGWAGSADGRAAFDDVWRAATLSDAGDAPLRLRRRRRWPRRLALAGVAAASIAALGVSLAVALDDDRGTGGDFAGPAYVAVDQSGSSATSDVPQFLVREPSGTSGGAGAGEFRVVRDPGFAAPTEFEAGTAPHGPVRRVVTRGGDDDDVAPSAGVSEPALGRGPGAQIVKRARIEIGVDEGGLDGARGDVRAVVDRAGGFVERSERSPRSVSLTVRIPAGRFEDALAEIEEVGEVRQQSVSGDDVSAELVDLEARLRHWQAQESVLLGLMEEATTVSESIDVRRELAPVQETIERLEGRLRVLEDDVEYSTIDVFLVDPDVETPDTRDSDDSGWFDEVWSDATGLGRGIVRGTIVALGALVPIAALWVAPVMAVIWLRRRRVRAGFRE